MISFDEEICCPHCDSFNSVDDIEATKCIENTAVSWKPNDSISEVICEDCSYTFWIQAHVDIKVSKNEIT